MMQRHERLGQLEVIIRQVRKNHPEMSLRYIYRLIKPEGIGRDRFERYFSQRGYSVGRKRSLTRTTDSTGVIRFDNLLDGKKLHGVNQAWVSDITYYRIGERFYYLTFIMDRYSRRIVGHSVSQTLRTSHTTIPAFKMGLQTRNMNELEGLIFHSDGGGQFYCKEFIELTSKAKMLNSMGKTAYENPHAERVNGIIKNSYLRHYGPQNLKQLTTLTNKAVHMYNSQKPHNALNWSNPIQYESLSTF